MPRMPREFTRHDLETILASNVTLGGAKTPVHSDDTYRDGGHVYRIGDMLEMIKLEGMTHEKFIALPKKQQYRVAERAREKLRKREQDRERECKRDRRRQLRIDDLVTYRGHVVRAGDLDAQIKHLSHSMTNIKFSDQKELDKIIDLAMFMLKGDGKAVPRTDDEKGNRIQFCGTGPTIQGCVFESVDLKEDYPSMTKDTPPKGAAPKIKSQSDFDERLALAIKTIYDWCRAGNFRLEKPQGSSLHHLAEYSRVFGEGRFHNALLPGGPMSNLQDFVIEHNWAAAFAGGTDFNKGDFRLPYDNCAFEFRISGVRCVALYWQDESGTVMCDSIVTGVHDMWVLLPFGFVIGPSEGGPRLIIKEIAIADGDAIPKLSKQECEPLYALINSQVRACGIMLEAEVAVTEVIRAPHKLNQQREKMGRTKLRDHHVVVLNRRRKTAPLPDEFKTGEKRTSPRLHFRIGHWRHFSNHRTWINWQLVGDPDLGFVDKHYKL
jgi:hypothetical protein